MRTRQNVLGGPKGSWGAFAGGLQSKRGPTGVCEKTLLLFEPRPCNAAAETAPHPLIWCSESLSSQGSSHPVECFFTDTGMVLEGIVGALFRAHQTSVLCESADGVAARRPVKVSPLVRVNLQTHKQGRKSCIRVPTFIRKQKEETTLSTAPFLTPYFVMIRKLGSNISR